MSLAPASRVGAYDIRALIGTGGTGEVYRANDPRLKRDVAMVLQGLRRKPVEADDNHGAVLRRLPGERRTYCRQECAIHRIVFIGALPRPGCRDGFDFDAHVARQARDLDGGARRGFGREIAAVNFVHSRKVVHVFQVDGGFQDSRER